jgi:hypothetical protein
MKDNAESKRVRKIVGVKAKQCYLNAFRVIQHVPEYADADYVEGMAVLGGLPIEHGWVEKDGIVIDPTLPDDEGEYFPGLRFAGERGLSKALQRFKSPELPFFYHFGWGGVDSPEFKTALIAAYRHAGWEDMAKRYEEYKPQCVSV